MAFLQLFSKIFVAHYVMMTCMYRLNACDNPMTSLIKKTHQLPFTDKIRINYLDFSPSSHENFDWLSFYVTIFFHFCQIFPIS